MGAGSRAVVGVTGGDRRPSEEAQERNCIFFFFSFFFQGYRLVRSTKLCCLHRTIDEHNHNLL